MPGMNSKWDRLADATQPRTVSGSLSIITLGHVHADDLTALSPHFHKLEQLVLDIPPLDELARHRAELNRAIDAAGSDWVLVVREREIVDDALATEIAEAADAAKARGFRIRSVPFYCGKPMRIGAQEGEVRLFHRRYYMRYANKGDWHQLTIQGTVVRLKNILRSMSFDTAEAHRVQLARTAVPHSRLRQLLLFLRYAASSGTLDRNTLRYLWIEAGYDHESVRSTGS
jgi:hypothetical protein